MFTQHQQETAKIQAALTKMFTINGRSSLKIELISMGKRLSSKLLAIIGHGWQQTLIWLISQRKVP